LPELIISTAKKAELLPFHDPISIILPPSGHNLTNFL